MDLLPWLLLVLWFWFVVVVATASATVVSFLVTWITKPILPHAIRIYFFAFTVLFAVTLLQVSGVDYIISDTLRQRLIYKLDDIFSKWLQE